MTNEVNKLVDHLFRHESGKFISILTNIFGSENLIIAEDVVQDAFVEAIKIWTYKGMPDNPSAWIFKVARNKALNKLKREDSKRNYVSYVNARADQDVEQAFDHIFSEEEIVDDQLRMMFTCCHPSITPDSQIALILKTLCGFSIPEISRAFITSEENINKRLVRARKKIREEKIPFEVPIGNQLEIRLNVVLETIYLMFNEGYSASNGEQLIRYEICEEAIRLTEIIVVSPTVKDKSEAYALLALMLLNASRFMARQDENGKILTLDKQDRLLWDATLIKKGFFYLDKSAGGLVSVYHLLATISAYHCSAIKYSLTDWHSILTLYNRLVQIDNSPLVLLNRAIVLSKVSGAKIGMTELKKIEEIPDVQLNYLFYSTKAEFNMELHQLNEALLNLEKAIEIAPLQIEKSLLLEKKKKYLSKK